MGKDERLINDNKCDPSELCNTINTDPINMEENGAKLLTVRVQVNNVAFDKEVCVACIIYDKCHRILAFRGFCITLCKECGCDPCGTIRKKLVFVLPEDVNIEDLEVRCAANYIYPCE
ncbi:MAG: hypothetical protein N2B06_01250 [Clostridium sp.]